jgi:Zn-dependent peptidase ImmA (M78 family)
MRAAAVLAAKDPKYMDLTKVSYGSPNEYIHISDDLEMAEFILAHELGHKRGIFGADDIDRGDGDRTARNNKKIYDACFK